MKVFNNFKDQLVEKLLFPVMRGPSVVEVGEYSQHGVVTNIYLSGLELLN